MYAIVAIKHFYGPSVSAPKILDNGFETAKEAWTALKSEDHSETMSHNQANTTYYIIDEDDIPMCNLDDGDDMPDSEEDRVACDFLYRRVADAAGLNAYLAANYPYDDDAPYVFADGDEVEADEISSVTEDGYPLHYNTDEIKKFLNVCGDGECNYCPINYLLGIADTIEKKAVRQLVVGTT